MFMAPSPPYTNKQLVFIFPFYSFFIGCEFIQEYIKIKGEVMRL